MMGIKKYKPKHQVISILCFINHKVPHVRGLMIILTNGSWVVLRPAGRCGNVSRVCRSAGSLRCSSAPSCPFRGSAPSLRLWASASPGHPAFSTLCHHVLFALMPLSEARSSCTDPALLSVCVFFSFLIKWVIWVARLYIWKYFATCMH